ncbi:EpsG family protein [Salegentibacter salarius]|uniref:EpsG family protein n=1 Tax=Salegentibacter salarius TaxID=435906 RepID=UPI0009D52612|nr:EpsG family protein [Salegentibacter salarius]SLK04681.1 EpsG family protein [Salegentibacter salarius]
MEYFSTYIIYLGLLSGIILLLLTKKQVFAPVEGGILESYNKLNLQDYFILILLVTIVGLRYNVGVDWPAYKEYFEDFDLYKNLSFQDQTMEVGYYLINYFANYIGGGYILVFSIAACVSWFFVLKSVPAKLLPLIIFFIFSDGYFFWSMNGVRQFIAVAIFAYSIKFILSKKFLNYFLFIILAALFHQSAILLIPLFFIPYERVFKQKWWMIVFGISFVFSGTPLILSALPKIFKVISEFVPFLAGYNSYFDSQYYEARELTGTGLGYYFRILISFVLLIFSKPLIQKYPETRVYFVLFFLGVIIYNLFFSFQIVERFTTYFLFLRAYLLGFLVYYLYKSRTFNFIGLGILVIYFILFWSDIYTSANDCCPYQISI